jgi:hypothetical protein
MTRTLRRLGRLGLLGLVWFTVAGKSPGWERPPVRINTHVEFQMEFKVGPQPLRPTAPWYAYFPVDPRTLPSGQTSPYPPWPSQFPPPAPKDGLAPAADLGGTGATLVSYVSQYSIPYRPLSFPTATYQAEAPSYWYRNP